VTALPRSAVATGAHRTVLLQEAVDALAIHGDGAIVDATFGRGGHSREILARLGESGRLIALDRDPDAVAAASDIADPRFHIEQAPFSALGEVLDRLSVPRVDGVLMDLGVSSPQLDEAQRGFSLRMDGPLDMRMDPGSGEPIRAWLARASEQDIARVIKDHGEERFAKPIARAIVARQSSGGIQGTRELAEVCARAAPWDAGQHPATRTFQALRIHANRELEELEAALPQAVLRLAPGGRLVVISFHSLEDRIAKRFMRERARPVVARGLPLREAELPRPELREIGKPVRAGADEVARNPRARSAVMRVAEKLAA
jgi:16S rRNA (cytosine1402-N4)-methyltransferase